METKYTYESLIQSKKYRKYPWFIKTILKPGEKYSFKEAKEKEEASLKRKVNK